MAIPIAAALLAMALLAGLPAAAATVETTAGNRPAASPPSERLAQQGHRPCDPNCPTSGGSNSRVQPGSPAHFMRAFDANRDGKVSREEFRGPPQRFNVMDADKDGFVTREELETLDERRAAGAAPRPGAAAGVPDLPVIFTHTHLQPATSGGDDWAGVIRNAIARMDELGVRTAVIMSTPRTEARSEPGYFDGVLAAAQQYPDRFAAAGGGESLNGMIQGAPPDRVSETLRQRFAARAEEIARRGAVAFGEMTALHFSFFDGHPFEETQPDHPLFLLLADIAAKHDIPIDLHMEAVTHDWRVSDLLHRQGPNNPEQVAENITAFERLLAHNRRARIIWVHLGMDATGQRSVALTRRLLRENPNLYISITAHQNSINDEPVMEPGRGLRPAWRDLIVEFPDRFMLGTDTFFLPDNPTVQMPDRARVALVALQGPALPPEVKRKVAFKNAQRMFKLKPLAGVPATTAVASARPPTVTAPSATSPAAAPAATAAPRILSEADIRHIVIGNTLNFRAPNDGRDLYVYFAPDGSVALKVAGQPGGEIVKRWFIDDNGMLCRTIGPANRNHCTRVQTTGARDTLTMLNPRFQYQATVISGRSLPQ